MCRPPRHLALTLVAAAFVAAGPARAAGPESPPPTIVLYTMGVGDSAFSKFGHAALCVRDHETPEGRCYNYGTAAFDEPVRLTWGFLRGRATFWVSVTHEAGMIAGYADDDRSLYRQVLPLSPAAARQVSARLARDELPEHRSYLYHHFHDNCATRLRDIIDEATGGALRAGADRPYGPAYRDLVRVGFAADLGILVLSDLLVGRFLETRPTLWQAMFLPDVLRAEVMGRLGSLPETVYLRRAPPSPSKVRLAQLAVPLGGVVLGLLLAVAALAGRRGPRRAALVVAGLALGLVAVALDGLALISTLAELRANELLLVFLPTDLALVALDGIWLRRYLVARLVLLAAVAVLAVAGLLVQPLGGAIGALAAVTVPFLLIEGRLRPDAR